jgi:Ser/Thr protein kinase RdoA (MazF antagonist)
MSRLPERIDQLLAQVNQAHGGSFRLAGRYAGGEQGAAMLVDEDGARYALKLYDAAQLPQLRYAEATTGRLRDAGYPAPAYRHIGRVGEHGYSVQTALPGEPARALTEAQARELCALNALQAGRAAPMALRWPEPVVTPMLQGGDGFCLLGPMRAYSPGTAALLAATQAAARAMAGASLPQDDVVHFDWTHANVLIAAGKLSGVIDWDGVCAGDRAFDLATMLFYSADGPAVEAVLWDALRERAAPQTIRLYLAHLAHRQVDWSIRFHGPAEVARWQARAWALLDP